MNAGRRWIAILTIAVVGLIGAGGVAAGLAAAKTPNTLYKVTFVEVGLPSGTSWSVTFNGTTNTQTASTSKFSGLASGYYSWSVTPTIAGTSGVQYVAQNNYASVSVPGQVTQVVVYQKQYQVTFITSPLSTGTTTPSGSPYYPAGETIALAASPYYGYGFKGWSATSASIVFGNKSLPSTTATIGGTGTITAKFAATKYKVSFVETGLPAATSWSVVFNGVTYFSSTSTLSAGTQTIGGYSWSAPAVSGGTGIQYLSGPGSSYMYVPYQTTQSIVFLKQWSVAFAVSPSTGGYTVPSSTAYYTDGAQLAIGAGSTSTTVFSGWAAPPAGLFIGSRSSNATNVTVGGTGTLTAKFVSGTPCSTCTLTFSEMGLPAGTSWGLYFNGQFYGGSTSAITITGVTTGGSWSAMNPISAGSSSVDYQTATPYGYMGVPDQTQQLIVYTPSDFVSFVTNTGVYGGGSVYPASGFYPQGSTIAIYSSTSQWSAFSKWTASSASLLPVVSAKSAATFLTVKGPGTVTGNFVNPTSKVTFTSGGLPHGTTWGISFNGVSYFTSGASLNISSVAAAGSYYWYPISPVSGGPGVDFVPWNTYGYLAPPFQTLQVVEWVKQYWVTFQAGGTAGGSVAPSGSFWVPAGTIVAVSATNGTSVHFTAWSSTPGTAVTFGSTSQAATTATVKGTGTITASFA